MILLDSSKWHPSEGHLPRAQHAGARIAQRSRAESADARVHAAATVFGATAAQSVR